MIGTVPSVTSALNSPSTMVLTAPCNHLGTACLIDYSANSNIQADTAEVASTGL